MMTWHVVSTHVAKRCEVEAAGPTWLEGVRGGVRFRLEARVASGDMGIACVRILVAVCGEGQIDTAEALRVNAVLMCGALAIEGGVVLRQVLPLDTVTPTDLDRSLEYLTRVAQTLRARLLPAPAQAVGCFTQYAQ